MSAYASPMDSMATHTFSTIFREFFPHPELVSHLSSLFTKHNLLVGDLLVKAGETNDRFYFLASGMIRGFYNTDTDTAITSWFEIEGGYIAIPHSYFGGEPSRESIEVLENGLAFSLSSNELHRLQITHPALGLVLRAIIIRYMTQMEHQIRALRLTKARERVDYFRLYFPEVYRRAPLGHIASFLSMTPQTLSKIRAIRKK